MLEQRARYAGPDERARYAWFDEPAGGGRDVSVLAYAAVDDTQVSAASDVHCQADIAVGLCSPNCAWGSNIDTHLVCVAGRMTRLGQAATSKHNHLVDRCSSKNGRCVQRRHRGKSGERQANSSHWPMQHLLIACLVQPGSHGVCTLSILLWQCCGAGR
jgi:hypothetical protein